MTSGQFMEHSENNQGTILPSISKDKLSKDKVSKECSFSKIFLKYPKKIGRKEAERHFMATVKTIEDFALIGIALEHYLKSERVAKGFVQNASTWFNNWQDWVDFEEIEKPKKEVQQIPSEPSKSYTKEEIANYDPQGRKKVAGLANAIIKKKS